MEDRIGGSDGSRLPKKARHSSYLGAKYDNIEKFKAFFEASFELKCLRTFLPLMLPWLGSCYLTHNVPLQLLPKLLCLRVLSLSGYCIVELPDSIGDLKHLRYFDLSCTQIKGLPESTTTLYNLQTLILENCQFLKELPSKLGNLVNLRHLNILNAKKLERVPPQIGKLTFLHTLSNLIVGKDNYSVLKEVGSLLHLRGTLIISRLENAIGLSNASDAKLIEKLNLTELRLEWSVDVDDSQDRISELEVLNMLQPNETLKKLTISWYGGTQFSTWLKGYSFPHMVLLRIENCKKCTSLPPVGQLPSLEQLFIVGMASVKNVDKEFYGNGSSQPFSSLKILHFEDMKEWENWSPNGGFPHLLELYIRRCPKLKKLPIGPSPSLKVLSIAGVNSVKNIGPEFYGEGCSQPFGSLKTLRFEYMKEWENWSPNGGFPQLRELYIENCPKLNKLAIGPSPSLKVLSIDGMDSVKNISTEFYGENCSQPFRSLETLSFKNMKEWENWRSNREFTQLCELYIENCPKLLGELPNHLPSLKDVEIKQCEGLQASFRWDNYFYYEGYEVLKWLVCRNEADFSLHMSNCLSRISEFTFPTERIIFYAEVVSFEFCKEMTHLSSNVLELLRRLPSLRVIRFEDCPKLVSLGTEEVKEQPHVLAFPSTLREIEIRNCNALESLPNAVMYNNTCLEKITIVGCDSLKHFAIDGCQKLVSLVAEEVKEQPHVLAFPSTLREIDIDYCKALESLPKAVVYNNTCLEKITIHRCDSLKRFAIGQLPQTLKRLEIKYCENMVILVDDTSSRSSSTSLLEYLYISLCPSLKSLGFPMGELPATLKDITIYDCEKLESIAESFHPDSSLERIHIWCCKSLKSLPMGIHTLNHLETVSIGNCPSLVSFPDRGLLPGNIKKLLIFELGLHDSILSITLLQHLTISDSNNIEAFIDWGFDRLTSLKSLKIDGCPNLVSFPEMMLPASLIKITIQRFHDLKLLSSKGFRNLASLKMLCIRRCENLTSFPEDDRLPPSLEILLIRGCPRLKESCKKDNEREWSKIAHIPLVKIDGRFIYDSEGKESSLDIEESMYEHYG